MAQKTERFGLVLTPAEREALKALAVLERLPEAAVIRRLIWQAAQAAQIPAAVGYAIDPSSLPTTNL